MKAGQSLEDLNRLGVIIKWVGIGFVPSPGDQGMCLMQDLSARVLHNSPLSSPGQVKEVGEKTPPGTKISIHPADILSRMIECMKCKAVVRPVPERTAGCQCDPDAPTWCYIGPDGKPRGLSLARWSLTPADDTVS